MDQLTQFAPLLLMVVFVYFFMIRPQMNRQKKEKAFAAELKRGDRVVTKSGMHGKVVDFSEKLNSVVIETGAGKITFDRSSVSMEMSEKLKQNLSGKK